MSIQLSLADMFSKLFILLFLLYLVGCATSSVAPDLKVDRLSSSITDETVLYLKMPWTDPIQFSGELDLGQIESASGGAMYYGGLGTAGVIAQLMAHGAASSAAKKKRYTEIAEEANKILLPYDEQLQEFDHNDLWVSFDKSIFQQPLDKYNSNPDLEFATVIDIQPEFILSQDERSLSLDTSISIYKLNNPDDLFFQNNILVVSDPVNNENITDFWNDQESQPFKRVGTELFNSTLELVAGSYQQSLTVSSDQKTHRYLIGSQKQFERGYLIRENCERVVLKNLRGDIIDAPKVSDGSIGKCLSSET